MHFANLMQGIAWVRSSLGKSGLSPDGRLTYLVSEVDVNPQIGLAEIVDLTQTLMNSAGDLSMGHCVSNG